ncbi:uncharacterized protein LOC126741227 [Anthonomus grandis grandis]|uniref:uncharacterized protein LOC126741227 n=1 Tax=Anthonomus grandis grandis TaxID=2921223 RepID=UPI002165BA6B|nr:uncharacterized protein LOC126741227 [Anthonomus grandis grandis]
MGFVEDELSEVKKLCEHVVPGTKLVSCVPTMVRVEIKRTQYKTIIVCAQFPEEYPKVPLLYELKSKTLSEKLLLGLTDVSQQDLKKYLGKAQVLPLIKFLRKFIDENSLICCYDEISALRKLLSSQDDLKIKQKTSSLLLKVYNGKYYLRGRITVPDVYPLTAVDIQDIDTNFTLTFYKHMVAQAKEIARRCVEPPLKPKPKDPPFVPGPSLQKTINFLIDCVKRLPTENCQFCKKACFPEDPQLLEREENSPNHIERVYCGHLFHQGCLLTYMKQPPFGNKKCDKCGQKISHFRWDLNDRLAEARWAHEQARERELQEVTDFFT